MNIPEELLYAKSHEWVRFKEDGGAVVGLTDFAQNALGDIVFVNLPEVGDTVNAGDTLGDVESVKAVSDVFFPVSGTVSAVNESLLDDPAALNRDPYAAWLVELSDAGGRENLLCAGEYADVCKEEE